MFKEDDQLRLGTIIRRFRWKLGLTWALVLMETVLFAILPLMIGWAIDGLLQDDFTAFIQFAAILAALLVFSIARRVYDTRVYGTIRVEMGRAQATRGAEKPVSKLNAQILMGRELVDFLESMLPEAATAVVQLVASVVILLSFHSSLALSSGAAGLAMLVIFGLSARAFFRSNAALNRQTERQVSALETRNLKRISAHFLGLRGREVQLSDLESLVYGLIFLALLTMLGFNLWFAATQLGASPGQIFSIVTYSFEFVTAAVVLPVTLQSLTRLSEIVERINKGE